MEAASSESIAHGLLDVLLQSQEMEIDRFLARGIERDSYMIMDWQARDFAPGQLGVIRVGKDARNKEQLAGRPRLQPGVYAFVEVETRPHPRGSDPEGLWLEREPEGGTRQAVDIRYVRRLLSDPILLRDMVDDPKAQDKYLLSGFQAASMPLAASVFDHLLALSATTDAALDQIERGPIDTHDALVALERQFAHAVPQVKESISRRIERGRIAREIKKVAEYRCLICAALGSPTGTFVKRNGEPYIEVHHVTPAASLAPGVLGIGNLMTVCATHHRQLHYGDADVVMTRPSEFCIRLDGQELIIPRFSVTAFAG